MNFNQMEYQNFSYSNKELIELMLHSQEDADIVGILIGAVNEIDDWMWLQNLCLEYIEHKDFWISKTAISSLGDIARIHNMLEKDKVIKLLKALKNPKLKETIDCALEDISIFLN